MGGGPLAVVSFAGSLLSAKATMDAGKAQRYMYDAQARQAEIKARQDALAYKEQGVEVLRQRNKQIASAMAKGGAAGFNFTEAGNPIDILNKQTRYNATKDFMIARDNASMAVAMGTFQANNLRTAGKNAQQAAKLKAFGQVMQGVGEAGSVYGTGGFTGNTGFSGFTSDRRLKQDIVRIGTDEATTLPLYEFSYIWNPVERFIGVMADEVEQLFPQAIINTDLTFKMVNYDLLGIEFRKVING